jgi:cytochrome c oxidase subunit 3
LASLSLFSFAVSVVSLCTYADPLAFYGMLPLFLVLAAWWRDVLREAFAGFHTGLVFTGLWKGFLLFLVTELVLFASFFWGMLHNALSPSAEAASLWPPVGLLPVDATAIPSVGSVVLLGSGLLLTYSHIGLVAFLKLHALVALATTIVFGLLFLVLQFTEYVWATLTIADSVMGSSFFMTTGLHALHVIAGALFLSVSLYKLAVYGFTAQHHLGFESSVSYWHLVDIVWLAVFFVYYIW